MTTRKRPSIVRTISRRGLLQQAAAVTAFTVVAPPRPGGRAYAGSEWKDHIAGVALRVGKSFLHGCAQEQAARIAFLWRRDTIYAKPTFDEHPQASVTATIARCSTEENKNIDAGLSATPDHTHAMITIGGDSAG